MHQRPVSGGYLYRSQYSWHNSNEDEYADVLFTLTLISCKTARNTSVKELLVITVLLLVEH